MNDDDRLATADLTRLAEPGDAALAFVVRCLGAPAALAAVRRGRFGAGESDTLHEVAAQQSLSVGAWNLTEALHRWALRLGDCDAQRDLRVMAALGGRLVLPNDEEWPAGIDDLGLLAPLGLWARGGVPLAAALEGSIAVVGARAASAYGVAIAKDFAFRAARDSRAVVSGGAFGIDAAAHGGALLGAEGGSGAATVAFMAGGVDSFYPRAHVGLLTEVARHGLVLSETAPGMTPMRHRFLQRNRLIAAAAEVTVVVEAGWRSGAINTAHHAVELGRELAAVPGSIHSATSAGCHRLVREAGAMCVTSYEDVLALIGPLRAAPPPGDSGTTLGGLDLMVFDALPLRGGTEVTVLAKGAGLTVGSLLPVLARLELEGRVSRSGNGWSRAAAPSAPAGP